MLNSYMLRDFDAINPSASRVLSVSTLHVDSYPMDSDLRLVDRNRALSPHRQDRGHSPGGVRAFHKSRLLQLLEFRCVLAQKTPPPRGLVQSPAHEAQPSLPLGRTFHEDEAWRTCENTSMKNARKSAVVRLRFPTMETTVTCSPM